jgi:Ca2+-binding RTX toxin-like protein
MILPLSGTYHSACRTYYRHDPTRRAPAALRLFRATDLGRKDGDCQRRHLQRFHSRAGDGQVASAGFLDITGVTTGDDNIDGLAANDIIFGYSGSDVLDGGPGADQLNGGPGNDWASYVDATSGVTASFANPAVNTGEAAGDTYTSI